MSENHKNIINSKILKSSDIIWRELKFLQQNEFKEWGNVDKQRLKNSLVANQFIQPFYVWEDTDGTHYCLDGKHRTLGLEELVSEGVNVPEKLPAIFIDCKNRQDAAKLVLIFSSAYAKITQAGFDEFISINELDLPDFINQISIPALEIEELIPFPEVLDGEAKAKPATMKITFASHQDLEAAMPFIDEILKAKFPGAYSSVSFGEI